MRTSNACRIITWHVQSAGAVRLGMSIFVWPPIRIRITQTHPGLNVFWMVEPDIAMMRRSPWTADRVEEKR